MPLTSKTKLYRNLPSCMADQVSEMSVKRRNDYQPSAGVRPMLSVEAKRALGRPPHCGPRKLRARRQTPVRTATDRSTVFGGSDQVDSPSTAYSDKQARAGCPADSDAETDAANNLIPSDSTWVGIDAPIEQLPFEGHQQSGPTLAEVVTGKSSNSSGGGVDENLVHLLTVNNIRDGSRPSSGGSSTTSTGERRIKRRESPRSPAVGSGGVGPSQSHLTRRSPRTALSLDNVDLWDDSCSDRSSNSSSTTHDIRRPTWRIRRRPHRPHQTVDVGGSGVSSIITCRMTVDWSEIGAGYSKTARKGNRGSSSVTDAANSSGNRSTPETSIGAGTSLNGLSVIGSLVGGPASTKLTIGPLADQRHHPHHHNQQHQLQQQQQLRTSGRQMEDPYGVTKPNISSRPFTAAAIPTISHERTIGLSSSFNARTRRTIGEAESLQQLVVGRSIPRLIESTGRPSTASRRTQPSNDPASNTSNVRINFRNAEDLRLFVRGLQIRLNGSTASPSVATVAEALISGDE